MFKQIIIPFTLFSFLVSANADTLLKENFKNLTNWEDLHFEKIDRHSTYEIQDSILIAKSDNSASGIKFKKSYDIFKYPVLKFSWKINNVYEKGNALKKDGDDYPIRIYIMFEYDPDEAGFWDSIKYDLAKSIYGEYPPHSSLNYIWSNKVQENNGEDVTVFMKRRPNVSGLELYNKTHIKGAHGYIVKPQGAQRLVDWVWAAGVLAADVSINSISCLLTYTDTSYCRINPRYWNAQRMKGTNSFTRPTDKDKKMMEEAKNGIR